LWTDEADMPAMETPALGELIRLGAPALPYGWRYAFYLAPAQPNGAKGWAFVAILNQAGMRLGTVTFPAGRPTATTAEYLILEYKRADRERAEGTLRPQPVPESWRPVGCGSPYLLELAQIGLAEAGAPALPDGWTYAFHVKPNGPGRAQRLVYVSILDRVGMVLGSNAFPEGSPAARIGPHIASVVANADRQRVAGTLSPRPVPKDWRPVGGETAPEIPTPRLRPFGAMAHRAVR
jgi:hypothetical protein